MSRPISSSVTGIEPAGRHRAAAPVPGSMRTTLRQAIDLLGRRNRRRWLWLVALAIVASLVEAAGAGMIFVLMRMVTQPEAPIELPLVGDVATLTPGLDRPQLLMAISAAIGAFFVLRALVQFGAAYVQQRAAHAAAADLSVRLAKGYLEMPYAFHLRRNSSELIRNSHVASLQLVRQLFLPLITVASELLVLLGIMAVLVAVAPAAAALAVGVLALIVLVLLRLLQPRLKAMGYTVHRMNGRLLRSLQETLYGLRDIKLLAREGAFVRQYSRARRRLARASYLHGALTEVPRNAFETVLLLVIIGYFMLMVSSGRAGPEALSTLGVFAYAGLRAQPSLQRIIVAIQNVRFSSAMVEDVHADVVTIASSTADQQGPAPDPLPFEQELRLDGVGFRYDGAEADALTGVDLTIRAGEWIGICGPTGGGKTTLTDLITGLLHPTTGRVLVDGRDIREATRAWQRNLGAVPQNVFLTDDTLRRNIALGVDDEQIDEEAVWEAAQLAQLEDLVASLPDGLDTVVGERGVRVSGGQRQRVAIARILYRRPPVLIFDEGTSSLDTGTEAQLIEAIQRLRGTRTIVMVAHRLATVRRCDRIVLVEDGRVTDVAAYDELVARNGSFRRLAANV